MSRAALEEFHNRHLEESGLTYLGLIGFNAGLLTEEQWNSLARVEIVKGIGKPLAVDLWISLIPTGYQHLRYKRTMEGWQCEQLAWTRKHPE